MTQNLDLDLWLYESEMDEEGHARVLTNTDSNVVNAWVSNSGPSKLWSNGGSNNDYNKVKYYDPGDRYCDTVYAGQCNLVASTNGGHDAQGNYYSWGAVTAGQAKDLGARETASRDICPRGWKLPKSGFSSGYNLDNSNGTFAALFESYGWVWDEGYFATTLNGGTVYDIMSAPFYYIKGGYVVSGKVTNILSAGRFWSSVSSLAYNDRVQGLNLDSRLMPALQQGFPRDIGVTVRCIVKKDAILGDNVEIIVNPTISLDVAEEVTVEKSETNPSTADLKVKVSSNQPYSVNINAKDHAELISETSDVSIPSVSGALNGNSNGWGIMKPGDNTYTKITTSPQLFYQATNAEVKDILFKIGISTAPDLPNGEYSTDITVTVTQN